MKFYKNKNGSTKDQFEYQTLPFEEQIILLRMIGKFNPVLFYRVSFIFKYPWNQIKTSIYLYLIIPIYYQIIGFMNNTGYIIGGVVGTAATLLLGYGLYHKSHTKTQDPIQLSQIKPISQILNTYSKQFNQSGAIQKIIPRQFLSEANLEGLTSNLFYRRTTSHLSSLTKSLSQPIYDLLNRGGKRWRPILCMIIAELYGHKKEEVFDIAALCQIIHNGTLIVDDIQDSSTVRRDKQCVHLIYGVDISINAGNFMYFAPLNYMLKSNKFSLAQQVEIGKIYAEQMTSLHIGQGWDILWHNVDRLQGKYPTQDHYLQMTAHKTGVLARLSAKLVAVYLNVSQKQRNILSKFAETMGVAFQIQDDLLNLEGEQYIKTKGYSGQDIHQGKITLMVLYFLNSDSPKQSKDRLIQILKKKTTDKGEIKQAIQLLKKSGSFQKARAKMLELVDSACKDAEQNLPNNIYRHYLKELAEYGIKRNK